MRLVAIATLSYQLAQTVDSAHFHFGGPARPFDITSGTLRVASARPAAAQAGIREGDTILALNGRPLHQRTELDEYLRTVQAGASLRVTYSHPGLPPQDAALTLAPAISADRSWTELLMSLFMEFVTRWFCLALGLFVLVMRPSDPLAWLVLAMMLSFSNLESGIGNLPDGWAQPFRALGIWYSTFLQRSWPLWMLLFGLYFPDPSRKLRKVAWTRWAVGLPLFLFAVVNAFVQAFEHSGQIVSPALGQILRQASPVAMLLGFLAIGIFFMCLQLKRYTEPDPDARRRLKLLFWGANVSLSPIFAVIIYTSLTHVAIGSVNPVLLAAVVLLLFFVTQFFTDPSESVAWEAHAAGMIAGVLAALVLRRIPAVRQRAHEDAADAALRAGSAF